MDYVLSHFFAPSCFVSFYMQRLSFASTTTNFIADADCYYVSANYKASKFYIINNK